jgi:hypothetical protein
MKGVGGGVGGPKGRWRRDHDDYIDIQSIHLRRKLLEAFSPAACIPPLNEEIAPLLVGAAAAAMKKSIANTTPVLVQ